MADSSVAVTSGSGNSIDTRTEATNGNHRQVVVLGDPSVNAGVAPVDATNGLSVNVTNASVAVTNAGLTTVAGAVSGTEMQVDVVAALPAGTNNIGDVDVLTVNGVAPAFGSGVRGSTVQRVTIATDDVVPASQSGTWNVATLTTLTGGGVAHDNADSGNPIKIGAKAEATPSTATMVSDLDRTDLIADLDGALIVRTSTLGDLISESVSNTNGTSTAFTNFGATASARNYITAIHVFRTDAGTTPIFVDFRDGTAGAILYSVVIPPNGGAILPAGATPYFRTSTNTALAYDVSAATTTVYINVTGFKSRIT